MPLLPEQPPATARTAALILAAGGSRRLGRPKHLLPYDGGVLLDAVLATARACGFEQTVLVLGGAAAQVQASVDTSGCDIVVNAAFGEGCSSSIAAGMAALDPDTDAVVLLLGDQPGVRAATVRALAAVLVGGAAGAGIAVCCYEDGPGHPIAFARRLFPGLSALHGDKAVWKLLEQRAADVVELAVPGPVPPDVDTEEDYRRLLAGQERVL